MIEPLRRLIGLKTLIFRDWHAKIRPGAVHPLLKVLVSGLILLSDFSGFNLAQIVKRCSENGCTRQSEACPWDG